MHLVKIKISILILTLSKYENSRYLECTIHLKQMSKNLKSQL
jgi:hypothetical protein